MGNAMAILKGTDTADKRIFIISGHLDSRVTDVMNRSSNAPGANDDGSGVAAVLECARVMSKTAFPATIIFVAVCGEEQGLLGAEHLAEKAKQITEITAMLNNDIMGSNNSSDTKIIDNTKLRVLVRYSCF
jgi:Zn-dependent M28 family amino/carboxypeptidase